jgi:hypothetical protein
MTDYCPFCESRVYRGSVYTPSGGYQVYRCNDLTKRDCALGREPIARTKPQLRRLKHYTDELEEAIE